MSIVRTKQKRGNKHIKDKRRKDKRRNYTGRNYTGRNYTRRKGKRKNNTRKRIGYKRVNCNKYTRRKDKRSKRYTKKKIKGGAPFGSDKKLRGMKARKFLREFIYNIKQSKPGEGLLKLYKQGATSEEAQLGTDAREQAEVIEEVIEGVKRVKIVKRVINNNNFSICMGLREIEEGWTGENVPWQSGKSHLLGLLSKDAGILHPSIAYSVNDSEPIDSDISRKNTGFYIYEYLRIFYEFLGNDISEICHIFAYDWSKSYKQRGGFPFGRKLYRASRPFKKAAENPVSGITSLAGLVGKAGKGILSAGKNRLTTKKGWKRTMRDGAVATTVGLAGAGTMFLTNTAPLVSKSAATASKAVGNAVVTGAKTTATALGKLSPTAAGVGIGAGGLLAAGYVGNAFLQKKRLPTIFGYIVDDDSSGPGGVLYSGLINLWSVISRQIKIGSADGTKVAIIFGHHGKFRQLLGIDGKDGNKIRHIKNNALIIIDLGDEDADKEPSIAEIINRDHIYPAHDKIDKYDYIKEGDKLELSDHAKTGLKKLKFDNSNLTHLILYRHGMGVHNILGMRGKSRWSRLCRNSRLLAGEMVINGVIHSQAKKLYKYLIQQEITYSQIAMFSSELTRTWQSLITFKWGYLDKEYKKLTKEGISTPPYELAEAKMSEQVAPAAQAEDVVTLEDPPSGGTPEYEVVKKLKDKYNNARVMCIKHSCTDECEGFYTDFFTNKKYMGETLNVINSIKALGNAPDQIKKLYSMLILDIEYIKGLNQNLAQKDLILYGWPNYENGYSPRGRMGRHKYKLFEDGLFDETMDGISEIYNGNPTEELYCIKKIIEPTVKVIIIGDIHSSLYSLNQILIQLNHDRILNDDLTLEQDYHLVFLGDLVDRGGYSLEVLLIAFTLKIKNREKVTIINGNHEDPYNYNKDGLKTEMGYELNEEGSGKVENILSRLPCALFLGYAGDTKYFQLCHGGIDWYIHAKEVLERELSETSLEIAQISVIKFEQSDTNNIDYTLNGFKWSDFSVSDLTTKELEKKTYLKIGSSTAHSDDPATASSSTDIKFGYGRHGKYMCKKCNIPLRNKDDRFTKDTNGQAICPKCEEPKTRTIKNTKGKLEVQWLKDKLKPITEGTYTPEATRHYLTKKNLYSIISGHQDVVNLGILKHAPTTEGYSDRTFNWTEPSPTRPDLYVYKVNRKQKTRLTLNPCNTRDDNGDFLALVTSTATGPKYSDNLLSCSSYLMLDKEGNNLPKLHAHFIPLGGPNAEPSIEYEKTNYEERLSGLNNHLENLSADSHETPHPEPFQAESPQTPPLVSTNPEPFHAESPQTPWLDLPDSMGDGKGKFKVITHYSGRNFGPFQEKTLLLDKEGKQAVDTLCSRHGYTQEYDIKMLTPGGVDGLYIMSKIPALILIIILQEPEGYKDETEKVVDIEKALRGAFPICMKPDERTAMNVIVSRGDIPTEGKYSVQKFCLYYPDNSKYDGFKSWPLIDGFSLRTGSFKGGIDEARAALQNMKTQSTGMTIDSESSYEDAIYWRFTDEDTDSSKLEKIQASINGLLSNSKIKEKLKPSHDPDLKARNITAAQEEFDLFKKEYETYIPHHIKQSVESVIFNELTKLLLSLSTDLKRIHRIKEGGQEGDVMEGLKIRNCTITLVTDTGPALLEFPDSNLLPIDISKYAIVNAANPVGECVNCGGIDKFIDKAGGSDLKQDRKINFRNKAHPAIAPGAAAITTNKKKDKAGNIRRYGRLNVGKVIHAVGPDYRKCKNKEDISRDDELLKNAYLSALDIADSNGIEYIGFPLLAGSIFRGMRGNLGEGIQSLSNVIMLGLIGIVYYLKDNPETSIKSIVLYVNYNDRQYESRTARQILSQLDMNLGDRGIKTVKEVEAAEAAAQRAQQAAAQIAQQAEDLAREELLQERFRGLVN